MAITNPVFGSHSIGNELPLFGANYFEKNTALRTGGARIETDRQSFGSLIERENVLLRW